MPSNDESPVDLWSLADLSTPWCLHVVATLRIAEHIAAGKETIDELAVAAECDPYVLHRVLDTLVSKGVFEQPETGRFALNVAARGLLDPGMKLGLDLEGLGGRMAHAWSTLLPYVRSGEAAYHQVFGLPFWDDLDAHPKIRAQFDALIGPAGHGTPSADFGLSGGWDSIQTVVDVGGGTGAMLAEILRAHPHVHGTLVDVARAIQASGELLQAGDIADRMATCAQSFFDPLPAGADLYVLRGVLNDWPDRETVAILKRCTEAARPNGRVVVLKSIGAEGGLRPLMIEMILLGGKHRTVDEFRPLAREAGLDVIQAGWQGSYFVVECRPA